jgi:hypothetical protein
MKSGGIQSNQAFCISLLPDRRLTGKSLEKQTANCFYRVQWPAPCLKFISFENGVLTLRSTSNDESYTLQLHVRQQKLLVACNCGHDKKTICKHAYWALNDIHWKFGETYFTKFAEHGMMELAFKYPMHFDKQESNAGINVFPRVELKSIYQLAPATPMPDIEAILKLPEPIVKASSLPSLVCSPAVKISEEKVMAYLIILSHRYENLPSVIPIIGQLTVKRTAIKAFDSFTSGLEKANATSLSDEQKSLHESCLRLFKLTEKIAGELLADNLFSKQMAVRAAIFNDWVEVYSSLLTQPFVFTYVLYGKRELRKKPRRDYWLEVTLSPIIPVLSFVLTDKGDYYRFTLQAHIDGVLLENLMTDVPLFISEGSQLIFRLRSLRDACLVEWFNRSGDRITVFKEHFEAFQKEVLAPLQEYYTVFFE